MVVRSGGLGLGGILIILGVFYFSGAAGWLWDRIEKLDEACYSMLNQMGTSMGGQVCAGIAHGIERVDRFGSSIQDKVPSIGKSD